MLMHRRCYNLSLSTAAKSRLSLILVNPPSYHRRRPHLFRQHGRQYTRIAHSESSDSVHTAAFVYDSTFLTTGHATDGTEIIGGCNVRVNVVGEVNE